MEASELFDICRQLAQDEPSVAATRQLHELLVLCAAEGCRQQGGMFGNLFAQTDFLCKTLGMSASDSQAIQTARLHSNCFVPVERENWLYDLRAIALLVSAVFHTDIPETLLRLLPALNRPHSTALSINLKHVRCVVSSFNEHTIQADTEQGPICVDYGHTEQGRDFTYLQKLLLPGMQLNLLDCHVEDEGEVRRVVPGLVVVEPDFMVDISSLAACFTNYGHHPLIYTLNRLKYHSTTQAMLLGDFSGTALDAIISQPTANIASILQRAYKKEALRYCACPNFNAQAFKVQSELQVRNVRQAVDTLQPLLSKSPALLEPSFVCERLGLQGRVDLMTTDMGLLVEQKSGKNMKIEHQSHDAHGLQLESHYVQLLLYYGVLRYNFGRTDRLTTIRLLYSRYPVEQGGLLTVNYYRTLFREAMRLRNQIVATELMVARQGFGRLMPLLNVDTIYKGITRDGFFHQYIEPELAVLTDSLTRLTPLERTYFERMTTFVYREQRCQKLGNSETRLYHSGGCTADLWQMPLAQKLETGNIMMNLTIISQERTSAGGGYDRIELTPSSTRGNTFKSAPNFRQGDMVYLYTYEDEPNVCSSILYKGTLEHMGDDGRLVVLLNNGQQSPHIFAPADSRLWAVEHGSSDVVTSASLRGLYQLVIAPAERRQLLLGQREPRVDTLAKLSRRYHPDYDDVLLRIRQSRDYFLLVGPPGTGKTSMALRFIVEEAATEESNKGLLLCAYTNRAVDEICDMLVQAGRHFIRLGYAAACDERFHPYLLDEALNGLNRQTMIQQIKQTTIVVGTTSMLQQRADLFQLKHFSLCVVDEASQILEPALMGLLGRPEVERFVLIGDHKQLPAVVQQSNEEAEVTDECLRNICIDDTRQSLFQRLLRWERHEGRSQFIGTLHRQGRMHPLIAQFPSQEFYALERLDAAGRPHQLEDAPLGYELPAQDDLDDKLKMHRMLFLPVKTGHSESSSISEHSALIAEATLVADLLCRIHRFTANHFDAARTVGVIVPYRSQIALIRQAIATLDIPDLKHISIDTVERYQGSQRDVIIYSFAVTRYYQLDFLTASTFIDTDGHTIDRKLNVALTRARRQLIMVGQEAILKRTPLFCELIERYAR